MLNPSLIDPCSAPDVAPVPTFAPTRTITGRVSFVIPTKDSARTIGACVRSAAGQDGDVEVLVVDNHSSDATAENARTAGARVMIAGPERSAQRNVGLDASNGEFVVFIDSDMVLRPGLADAVRRAFAADPTVGGLVLPEFAFGDGYLARCRALEKRAYLGDPQAEASRAFRAEVLDDLGGYDERINAFEDYELSDRVEAAGWRIGRSETAVDHDEGRIRLRTLLSKKRYYGSGLGVVTDRGDVEFDWSRRRGRDLRSMRRAMLRDPLHAPGLVVLKAIDGTGLLLGHLSTNRRS